MKENWINDMKRKLEGHKMAPPPGLWEDISQQMDKPFGLKPLSRLTGTAQMYWAAAAAVLALVGFFVFQNGNDSEQPQQANAVFQQSIFEQPVSEQPTSEHPAPQLSASQPILALANYHSSVTESQKEEETLPDSSTDSTDSSAEVLQTHDEPQQTEDLALQAEKHDEPQPSAQSYETLSSEKALPSTLPLGSSKNSQQNKWSLGLNASGGLLAANTSQRMDRLYYSMSDIGKNSYIGPIGDKGENGNDGFQSDNGYSTSYTYTLTEYKSEHHLPIRFGVSLNYHLTSRIALHSGISYAYLYSEFSIPLYPNIHYDQKLHYLGVPFGVTWQLWSTNRFRFYLSGGMMLEKCVSADLEGSGKVSTKPWQWSVEAAAGAEYAFTRQLGFYLEPSLGYYFDDGTSLEHYYKEHPLAPSIEFGLRLHLNE